MGAIGPSWICCVGSSYQSLTAQIGECSGRHLTHPASSALPILLLLQAKFFTAVQGELNCCNSMGALEMHQRLEQLKRSIYRVHQYSQGEAQPLPGSGNPANLSQGPSSLVLKSSS